jgi:protein-disulfide isomerase
VIHLMTNASRLRLGGLIAALLLAACGKAAPAADAPFAPVPITPYLEDAVMGDPAAPVTITEYASTTCGHCYAFHEEVLPKLKAKYIDTGKAKLIYRVLPTPPGPVSAAGAAIARCAGKDQFFAVIQNLFDDQEDILDSVRNPADLQKRFTKLGARYGLTPDEVRTCIEDKGIQDYLLKVIGEAPEYVTSTPTLIVDGEHIKDHSLEALSAAIDAKLPK